MCLEPDFMVYNVHCIYMHLFVWVGVCMNSSIFLFWGFLGIVGQVLVSLDMDGFDDGNTYSILQCTLLTAQLFTEGLGIPVQLLAHACTCTCIYMYMYICSHTNIQDTRNSIYLYFCLHTWFPSFILFRRHCRYIAISLRFSTQLLDAAQHYQGYHHQSHHYHHQCHHRSCE